MVPPIHPIAVAAYFALLIPPFMIAIFLLAISFSPARSLHFEMDFRLVIAFIFYLIGCFPAGLSGFLVGLCHPQSLLQATLLSVVICAIVMLIFLYLCAKAGGDRIIADKKLRFFTISCTLVASIGGAGASLLTYLFIAPQ